MDCKQELINQIITNTAGLLQSSQQQQLVNILNISLYKYDVTLREECKDLPATVDDLNYTLAKRYILARSIEGLSKKSIEAYSYKIRYFIASLDKKLTDITVDDIRFYFATLKTKNKLSNTSMEHTRSCLNTFFEWLRKSDYITKNPMEGIPKFKKDKKKKLPFSNTDLEKLRNNCDHLRDRAMLELLLASGCRVSELVNIKLSAINFDKREAIVIGKGGKEIPVRFNDVAELYMNRYLETRSDDVDYLFISKVRPYRNLSIDSVENMLKDLGEKSGVEKVHPHRFRRTFCTSAINRGAPLQSVSKMMNHENINTTMIYYSENEENIKNEYNKYIN